MNFEAIWKKVAPIALQHKEEFVWLLELIHKNKNKYKTVLEIGSYKGGTAMGFLELGCDVVCIDISPHTDLIVNLKAYDYFIHKLDSKHTQRISYGMLDAIAWDVLFIDGGHGYEDAKSDFENYGHLVRPGGIVAFHDINPKDQHNVYGCSVYWNEIKSNYKYEEKVSYPDTWGGIGVLYV